MADIQLKSYKLRDLSQPKILYDRVIVIVTNLI